ncbi:pilus assembly protein TadG-related protein [Nocardioides speluncae]|uniref:pilus assembly protein TadG-related protein n=1 Tax=Nocardioides speluncae TaxID=2670337 RepID=UPI000D69D941|nr:pilus assembly protein TadG-related protein [Nocardioides speluncae]
MTRDERGQTTPMIVGFFFILAILVAVVVDASAAYLQRQSLATLAEGAALSGANGGVTGASSYADGIGEQRADLDATAARAAVAQHLREAGAYERYPDLAYTVAVTEDGVVVRITAGLDLPLAVPGTAGGATIGAKGSAALEISG